MTTAVSKTRSRSPILSAAFLVELDLHGILPGPRVIDSNGTVWSEVACTGCPV